MKSMFGAAVAVSLLSIATSTYAQQSVLQDPQPNDSMANVPSGAMSPEMWVYLHEERRADDPATAIRRRAEIKANQREQRLASSRWYGLNNARPSASVVPIMGTYSPTWVGNGWNSSQWIPTGSYPRPDRVDVRR